MLISLFLLLHIIRHLVKKFRYIDGLAWLPLPAFLVMLALIPAYGFRPEAIPLLLYAAILTGFVIFRQIKDGAKLMDLEEGKLFRILPLLVLLAAALGTALYFTPQIDTAPSTLGVHTLDEREYSIRVYTDENDRQANKRPLILLLPPVFGSQAAVDQVCGELRDWGFTVISYYRRDFDSREYVRRLRTFRSGTISAKANSWGRSLEEAREKDLDFLLSWIGNNPFLDNGKTPLFSIASPVALFLAGYDAGGSALILRGNTLSRIRGLIAIESPLWSLYREEALDIPDPPPDEGGFNGWFQSIRYGLNRWFLMKKAKKITGLARLPELSRPLLILVSDKSRENKYRDGKYLALLRVFESARGRAMLASADGAGPLDYSDFPAKYPLITALLPGRGKRVWNMSEAPAHTAAIIGYFAASVLDPQERSSLKNIALPPGVRVELK